MLRFAPPLRLISVMKEFEFSLYVTPLRDRMYRYAQSLLLNPAEAEDVVQDLLEKLWGDRGRLDDCRSIGSFVMTSVRNRCYDRLRQRQARERRDSGVAGQAERQTSADAENWEARDMVRSAMSALPDRQREVLHLKDIEGWPTHEIAQAVGCDEAQVRTILSRARQALKEKLKTMIDHERTQRKD